YTTLFLATALTPVAASPAGAQPDLMRMAAKVATLRGPGGIDSAEIDDRADELYDEGREAIEEGKYDRAVDRFNKLIDLKTNRTDAALYWKAYSLAKLGQRA